MQYLGGYEEGCLYTYGQNSRILACMRGVGFAYTVFTDLFFLRVQTTEVGYGSILGTRYIRPGAEVGMDRIMGY